VKALSQKVVVVVKEVRYKRQTGGKKVLRRGKKGEGRQFPEGSFRKAVCCGNRIVSS
jgi:hypothetical protein